MKQERLTKPNNEVVPSSEHVEQKYPSTRGIDIDKANFKTHPLWNILVETTHRSPLYANLSGYVRENIVPVEPDISPRELATRLSISIGEALVILDDMVQE